MRKLGRPAAPRRAIRVAGSLVAFGGVISLCALSLGAQTTQSAQTAPDTLRLTLSDARARALLGNPELAAVRLDTAIAAGTLRQSRLLPFNPTASVLLGSGGSGNVNPVLSQELEVFGQRGLRVAGARAGAARAAAGVADVTRVTLADVDRAFYRLVAAASRTALADEVLALNTRLADVAARQFEAGQISRLDENLATVELGRSRARSLAARREGRQAEIELRRLTALPTAAVVVPVLDPSLRAPADTSHVAHAPGESRADSARRLYLDSLVVVAFSRRPDLRASVAEIRQSEAFAALARRTALPNVVVSGTSETSPAGGRVIRPGVGLALPLFNRNQGEIQARRAAVRQAELQRAALVARIRAEVAAALAAYRTATEQAEVFETTVLGPARDNRRLLETAYREGKFGLPVLLLIRNQTIDAELEYVSAWLAEREARVALDQTIGSTTTRDDASRAPPLDRSTP